MHSAECLIDCMALQVYPEKGTVSFSAGLHGWAFTLTSFAKIYAKKFGTDEVKMMEKLWGDNFFDPKTKKWTKKQTNSQSCKRGFCQFVYEPIKVIIEACMADDKKKLFTMLEKLSIADKVKTEDREKTGKPLMKAVMQASASSPQASCLVTSRSASHNLYSVFRVELHCQFSAFSKFASPVSHCVILCVPVCNLQNRNGSPFRLYPAYCVMESFCVKPLRHTCCLVG